ncbi:MAG: SUMF1/EgtB/PvdO family nonheme iron enzyme, partial [Planctomycetota bacterium]
MPLMNYFRNERAMLCKLQDCDVVPRYHFSVEPTPKDPDRFQPFHVMEYVKGTSLLDYLRDLPEQDKTTDHLLGLFREVIRATRKFHELGVIHRDLAPKNVLIDSSGKIWLIDVGESCPEVEEHTRTGGRTTVGSGTKPHPNWVRKTIREDVYDLCRLGFAIFDGEWPDPEIEDKKEWRRRLENRNIPQWISKIILKGMTLGDQTLAYDPKVWNSADEVDLAIEKVLTSQRLRKRLVRTVFWGSIAACALIVIGFLAIQRIREQSFHSELARLKDAQIEFSEKPREQRLDARVQVRINQADDLKEQAFTAKSSTDFGAAVALLKQAIGKISEAGHIVEDLRRLDPLVTPLVKILSKKDGWSNAPVITRKLSELGKRHQEIQQLVRRQTESGQGVTEQELPEKAWDMLAALQPDLVNLIKDNQTAFEIEALLNQLSSQCASIAPELKEEHESEYNAIQLNQDRAQRYYEEGNWDAAMRELTGDIKGVGDGALEMVEKFLNDFETTEQRNQRLASNTDQIATQVAAAESLRKQVKQMRTQLQAYKDALVDSARYKKERDDFQGKLKSTESELANVNKLLIRTKGDLTESSKELSRLEQLDKNNSFKIKDYEARLKNGTDAWKKQSEELANVKAELEANVALVERLSNGSGVDTETAKRLIALAKLEKTIESFDPQSWVEANERLFEETIQYKKLLQKRKQEIAIGKTDRHQDVKTTDAQLASQFRIVVRLLRKRDEQDQSAWSALDLQIKYQAGLKQATIDEGWSETSSKVREIETKIRNLANQQKPYESGRSRLASNTYDFKNWDELSSLPEVKFAKSLAAFGDLKQGTKYSDSLGQNFIFIPPGTFKMGSPENETGRSNDETPHEVTLSHGFFVATTETTQGIYKGLTGQSPWSGESYVKEGDQYPAVYVSWDDAKSFIKKLNQQERENGNLPPGWEYRLLTEAQWEYAARAGSSTRFCFGDDESKLGDYAWYDDNAWDIGNKF